MTRCLECKRNPMPGYKKCEHHVIKDREYAKAYYKRKNKGVIRRPYRRAEA